MRLGEWFHRLRTKPPAPRRSPARLSVSVMVGNEGFEVIRYDSEFGGMIVLQFGGQVGQSITLHADVDWHNLEDQAPLDRICEALANPTRRVL